MAKREGQPRSGPRRGTGLARFSPRAPKDEAGIGRGSRIWSGGQPMAVLGRGGGAVGAGGDALVLSPPECSAGAGPGPATQCGEAAGLGREGVRPRRAGRARARPNPRRELAGRRS